MTLTVEEIDRENHRTKGVVHSNGIDLFGFLDYGYPDKDLELECIDPSGMEVRLGELVEALSGHIPDLSSLNSYPPDWRDLTQRSNKPGLMVSLDFNQDGSWVTLDWLHGQPPVANFSIPFAQAVDESEFRRRSERILLRHGLQILEVEEQEEYRYHAWSVAAACFQDQPLREVYECANLLTLAAHSAVWPDQPSVEEVLRIIHLGHVELLGGWLVENEWFDAKERVDLGDAQGRLEFAKDLAQFANGPTGGILLIGAKTDVGEGGIETFSKISPLDKNPQVTQPIPRLVQQLRAIAVSHIHPAIEGLRIELVSGRRGQLIYAHIPNQPTQMKPFIVTGEIISGKLRRNFFSVPVRTNDGNVPVTAHEIHSLLAGKMSRWQDRDGKER
ncbi:hypothetical protein [Streptomyces mirabilis]|uniref:hypothetical protein n=1 Tax=Streptomyces mirabilis TaxID=68239 RepID=UPI0036498A1A